MKKLFIQFLLFFVTDQFYLFCQPIPILNLTSAIGHTENIKISDFVLSITYVPLFTSYDCLIDETPKIYVTKEYIVSISKYSCHVFNRKNGAFIREISHYGRGPGEYQSTSGFFNDRIPAYFFTGWNGELVKYTMDGIFRGRVRIPGYKDNFNSPVFPMNYSFLNDSIIACDFLIATGTEPQSLMIFNEKEQVLMLVKNNNQLTIKQKINLRTDETCFYHFTNDLFFQNRYNDTIFKISSDKITPHFVLNRGKYRPSFESKWWSYEKQLQSNFISQPLYFETKRFVSFNFYFSKNRYFGLFDKKTQRLKVTDNSHGIKNDIDRFIDITFDNMNSDGELIGQIQANDLVSWIEKNPEKLKLLPQKLQNLRNIKMEDNPVVVIAKCKE
jgi:hypothetical protein